MLALTTLNVPNLELTVIASRRDLTGRKASDGENEASVARVRADRLAVKTPQLDLLVVRAGHKADAGHLSKLSDDVAVRVRYLVLELTLEEDAQGLVLRAGDDDTIGQGENGDCVRTGLEHLLARSSGSIPDACCTVPGATDELLRDSLTQAGYGTVMTRENSRRIASRVNVVDFVVLAAREESIGTDLRR